jgi:hypothetical protein
MPTRRRYSLQAESSTAAARRLKSENSDVSPILGCASDLNLPQRR